MGLLEDKTAVIYGGGGDIGSAVARAFLREGADVHVVGRTQERLDAVEGAKTAIVDALDEAQVEAHADSVGRIDVSLNVITHPYTHGTPFADLTVDEFMAPPEVALRSNFITSRAAVRRMIEHKAGVILFFGGTGAPMKGYHLGATQVAFDGMESLRRLISVEAGPYGVRAVSLVTGRDLRGGDRCRRRSSTARWRWRCSRARARTRTSATPPSSPPRTWAPRSPRRR